MQFLNDVVADTATTAILLHRQYETIVATCMSFM